MQKVRINKTEYGIPQTVSDIKLKDFITWTEIEAAEMPTELRQIVEEQDPEKKKFMAGRLSKRAYIKKVVPYYIRVLNTVTGIPISTLKGDRMHEGAPVIFIEDWYWQTVNALAKFEFDPGKTRFVIGGDPWTLPEEHMKKSTFGEFAEAAQYEDYAADVAAGNWGRMPYVMAVLLRPEGEEFDPYRFDEIVEERAEIMRKQSMDTVYQVSFFCSHETRTQK